MIIAMTLGRPVMLRRRHTVPLPEAIDDEYLLHNVPQPENHLSDLAFFKETNRLHKVMRDALAELYKDRPESASDSRKLDKTVELDSRLVKLQDELPDALHWDKLVPTHLRVNRNVLEQQRHVLHLRYRAARMGVHRPLFIEYCRTKHQSRSTQYPNPATNLAERFTRAAAVVCVQSSITMIDVVDRYAATEYTCEWWYNMFFIRMASAVLMITMTQPDLVEEIGQVNLDLAWQSCKSVLKHKLPANKLVQNCFEELESMYEQVERYTQATAVMGANGNSSMPPPISGMSLPGFIQQDGASGFDFLDGGIFSDSFFNNYGADEWGFSAV
jgi:hypothetical protein